MALHVWRQPMDLDFPLAVLDYTVRDDRDPMHWHDHFEIALVTEGRGILMFGGRPLEAEAGDVFLIDNSQPHVALADRGRPMRLLLVLFRPELIAPPGCRELESGYLAPFRCADGRSPRLRSGTPLAERVGELLRSLRAVWSRHRPAERHLLDATLRLALGTVTADHGAGAGDGAVRAATGRREQIRPVLAYVDGHCGEAIALADVARLVHVSPSRIRHLFREVTGVGFRDYVTQVRVAEAKRLLVGTDLSVADVAQAVAYTNLTQFYKVFRRLCGMSPGDYRRHYAGEAAPSAAALAHGAPATP